MSAIDSLTPKRTPPGRPVEIAVAPSRSAGARRGTVRVTPDGDGMIEVALDASPQLRETPCPYTPKLDTEPADGDLALLIYDETGRHYAIWFPA